MSSAGLCQRAADGKGDCQLQGGRGRGADGTSKPSALSRSVAWGCGVAFVFSSTVQGCVMLLQHVALRGARETCLGLLREQVEQRPTERGIGGIGD
eukprot:3673797-Rhodomonas_salina.1